MVAAGFGRGLCGSGEGVFLESEVGVEVDLGGLRLLWPSQSAITEVSTPACRSRIAAVCRNTCAVTRLV